MLLLKMMIIVSKSEHVQYMLYENIENALIGLIFKGRNNNNQYDGYRTFLYFVHIKIKQKDFFFI